jgi:hypothetical protein
MNISRRKLLTTSVLGAGALALANCTTAQIGSVEAEWASVAGAIQGAVANAAAYVPTIESIAATAASLLGPGYATLVQVGSAVFNQIVATLSNVVANLSPPASAKLHAKLRASSPQVPVTVGVTSTGVTVHGWKA